VRAYVIKCSVAKHFWNKHHTVWQYCIAEIIEIGAFCPKLSPQTSHFLYNSLAAWPSSKIFSLKASSKLVSSFKNFYWLKNYLMPSTKHNSKRKGYGLDLFTAQCCFITSSVFFANHSWYIGASWCYLCAFLCPVSPHQYFYQITIARYSSLKFLIFCMLVC